MKTSCLVLLAALLPTAAHAAETNAPALVIYTSGIGLSSAKPGPQFVAALWSDGRIVWSESRVQGAPPYQQGRFPHEKLAALMETLDRQGVFNDKALARAWLGPDSKFTTIAIDDGRRRLKMQSWHELFEQKTNLVATAAGITPLRGQKREDVLQAQPEEYRRFRNTWSEIRQVVAALIPQTGTPYADEIPLPERLFQKPVAADVSPLHSPQKQSGLTSAATVLKGAPKK